MLPGSETHNISLKNPEGIRERKRKQEVKKNNHEHEVVVRVQKKKIQSGRKKNKRFESEGGVRVLDSQREATWVRLSRGDITAGGVRRGSHSAGRCGISKKQERSREGSSRSEISQEF